MREKFRSRRLICFRAQKIKNNLKEKKHTKLEQRAAYCLSHYVIMMTHNIAEIFC